MTTLTPRLFFDGQCRQAMESYRSSLGEELIVTIMKDTPAKYPIREFQHHKVLNARLRSANPWLRPDLTPIRGNTTCLYPNAGPPRVESLIQKSFRRTRSYRSSETAVFPCLWRTQR
jgi:hypothetical protein